MRQGPRIAASVAVVYVGITALHLWLNIGFDRLGFASPQKKAEEPLRIGFLPVT